MKNHLPFNANKPTTTNNATTSPELVFKGSSSSAAVYRSLEVPLPLSTPSPLNFPVHQQQQGKLFPSLAHGQAKQSGSVVWQPAPQQQQPPAPGLFTFSQNCIEIPAATHHDEVVVAVNRLLAKHEVDVLSYKAFEWTCSMCANFVETEFVIRLFNTRQLDFQREYGCVFQFNSLFRDLQSELSSTPSRAAAAPRRQFKVLALPKELADEDKPALASACTESLLSGLCASAHIDVQREGLIKLARLLEQNPHCLLEHQAACQRLLQVLIQAKDAQVRRLAISALCLLTAKPEVAPMAEADLSGLVAVLLDERELPEARRQAGRIVCNLSKAPFADLVKSTARPISSAKIICSDVQLNEIVRDIRSFLAV